MARITSHALNSTDGTHAGGIAVRLTHLETGAVISLCETDQGGRLDETIDPEQLPGGSILELTFNMARYWQSSGISGKRLIKEIVLRITIDDPDGHYHMPIIVGPHGYSTWKSG